jgi:hypothetical protein
MKKIMTLAVIAAMAMTSCNSSDDEETVVSNYPDDNVIRVTTRVSNSALTRADGDVASTTSGYEGENFALYVSPSGVTNDFTYNNVWYTKTAGKWGPKDGVERHWQSASTNYEYYAYAPAAGSNTVEVSFSNTYISNGSSSGSDGYYYDDDYYYTYYRQLSNTSNQIFYDLSKSNIDLLWTSGSGTPNTLLDESKSLPITFDHKFCQFTIEVEIGNALYGDDFETCPVTSVSFVNPNGVGVIGVKTGKLTVLNSCEIVPNAANATIVQGSRTADGKYTTETVYMAPGDQFADESAAQTQAITVFLTVNGADYVYNHTAYKYEAGKSYTLKVKVGESGIAPVGVSISPWTEVDVNDELTTF